jgi:hypothetical protein
MNPRGRGGSGWSARLALEALSNEILVHNYDVWGQLPAGTAGIRCIKEQLQNACRGRVVVSSQTPIKL